jgi:hypothetical protein
MESRSSCLSQFMIVRRAIPNSFDRLARLRPLRESAMTLRRNSGGYARGGCLAMVESFAVRQKVSAKPSQLQGAACRRSARGFAMPPAGLPPAHAIPRRTHQRRGNGKHAGQAGATSKHLDYATMSASYQEPRSYECASRGPGTDVVVPGSNGFSVRYAAGESNASATRARDRGRQSARDRTRSISLPRLVVRPCDLAAHTRRRRGQRDAHTRLHERFGSWVVAAPRLRDREGRARFGRRLAPLVLGRRRARSAPR